jgi:hypothetical protein
MANILDLRTVFKPTGPDLPSLRSYLSQLVGEPFLFARVSYGNEFMLHFGAPLEVSNPKLRNRTKGSYILAARGSAWLLKAGTMPAVVEAGMVPFYELSPPYHPISAVDLERGQFVLPGARVVAAEPFVSSPTGHFGLLLSFTDGSSFTVTPTPWEAEIDEEGAPEVTPVIADWELLTPHGRYLWVGPGRRWGYEESRKGEAARRGPPNPTSEPKPPSVKPPRKKPTPKPAE